MPHIVSGLPSKWPIITTSEISYDRAVGTDARKLCRSFDYRWENDDYVQLNGNVWSSPHKKVTDTCVRACANTMSISVLRKGGRLKMKILGVYNENPEKSLSGARQNSVKQTPDKKR